MWQAAQAVAAGDAETVVVYRALNGRSGARVGTMQFAGMGGQYRYPIGYDAYLMYVAMWAQRFLAETGQGAEDLGAVAIGQRRYAERNARAYRREPLDLDEYLAEPFVVEPFRRSRLHGRGRRRLRRRRHRRSSGRGTSRTRRRWSPPGATAPGRRPGLDIGDHLLWEDYTRNYTSLAAGRAVRPGRRGSRVTSRWPRSTTASPAPCSWAWKGWVSAGGASRARSSDRARARLEGRLPTNTHGGLLAEGYLHGMNTVAEAVLQVQGRGGPRQAPRHEVAVVTSGALMDGSALVLTADR